MPYRLDTRINRYSNPISLKYRIGNAESNDRISFSLLSDDLFVKMMQATGRTLREWILSPPEGKLHTITRYLKNFSPDAIVMNRQMMNEISRYRDPMLQFENQDCVECRFFGILTRMCDSVEIMPYNAILLIKEAEPVPSSWMITFDL